MAKGGRTSGGEPPYVRAGFSTPAAYSKARAAAKDWSDQHSHQPISQYNSRMKPEAFGNYYRAFVSPVSSTTARRARGLSKSPYLKRYLVNDTGYMDWEEFRANYADLV